VAAQSLNGADPLARKFAGNVGEQQALGLLRDYSRGRSGTGCDRSFLVGRRTKHRSWTVAPSGVAFAGTRVPCSAPSRSLPEPRCSSAARPGHTLSRRHFSSLKGRPGGDLGGSAVPPAGCRLRSPRARHTEVTGPASPQPIAMPQLPRGSRNATWNRSLVLRHGAGHSGSSTTMVAASATVVNAIRHMHPHVPTGSSGPPAHQG
jgi:hypothetical protein